MILPNNRDEDVEITEENKKIKEEILNKFAINDLETLCYKKGIKKLNGNDKNKRFRERYIRYLNDKINLVDLIDFTKEEGIDISDVLIKNEKNVDTIKEKYEPDYYPNIGNREFEEFLTEVSINFKPEKCDNDEELKLQLIQFLKLKYPSKNLEIDKDSVAGKIDIVFDSNYGLKPVIADDREKLRELIGEMEDYLKICRDAAVIMLNSNEFSSFDLDNYAKEVTEAGAYFMIIGEDVKQKKINVTV